MLAHSVKADFIVVVKEDGNDLEPEDEENLELDGLDDLLDALSDDDDADDDGDLFADDDEENE